ncbi:fungal-specific transcription factor domain-containing protein [Xylogone sp. PMI_703]|nr:fungal-specific transcription factor domain-containing protein [Xylogone sp. PMI_703]
MDSCTDRQLKGPSGTVSPLACFSCKIRKVKCDKILPCCAVCTRYLQPCAYPQSSRKPGPKIGSRKSRPRKSPRNNEDEHAVTSVIHSHQKRSQSYANCNNVASWILYHFHDHQTYRPRGDAQYVLGVVQNPSLLSSPRTMQRNNVSSVCSLLGISKQTMYCLIDRFFENISAYSLFHRPTFDRLIFSVLNVEQSAMLLSAMFIFAAYFEHPLEISNTGPIRGQQCPSAHFYHTASSLIEKQMKDCGDDAPPLFLLQALILTTYYELISSFRGVAWRSLGMCIRIAYELELHEIDLQRLVTEQEGKVDITQWRLDEERRRAWWTLWRFDVFASTIRKRPKTIDIARVTTWLPVDDDVWFEDKYQPSCFLDADPMERWKILSQQSQAGAKAWYLVIGSLMHDAHELSSSRSIDKIRYTGNGLLNPNPSDPAPGVVSSAAKLGILESCLSHSEISLPQHLKFHGQFLRFEGPRGARAHDCFLALIYIMAQLGRLMIYYEDCFIREVQHHAAKSSLQLADISPDICDSDSWKKYLECANNVLQVLRSSSLDHIRFIDPLIVNTYWIMGAVQLVEKSLAKSQIRRLVAQSNYDFIKLCLVHHERFWKSSTILLENLNTLETRLGELDNGNLQNTGSECSHMNCIEYPASTLPTNLGAWPGGETGLGFVNGEGAVEDAITVVANAIRSPSNSTEYNLDIMDLLLGEMDSNYIPV